MMQMVMRRSRNNRKESTEMTEKAKKIAAFVKEWFGKIPDFLKTKAGKICIAVVAVVAAGAIGFGCYYGWLYQQIKFHDVTIELGEALPETACFLTEFANPQKAQLVTEVAQIDLNKVGMQTLTFAHGSKVETVTLTIEDTTAPMVQFRDVTVTIRDTVVPEDFVESVEELSEYTVAFAQELGEPEKYDGTPVKILVTDASGNKTTGECQVSYRWMRESCTLELGKHLGKGMLLYHYEKDKDLLEQKLLDRFAYLPVGTYVIGSVFGDAVNECEITIQDTTAPTVVLQDVAVFLGEPVTLEDFVVSATDISGEVTTRLAEPLPQEAGVYTVTVEAEDINGNIGSAQAQLRIIVDTDPPEFFGMEDMFVEKHSSPNYYYGVTAVDERDGEVEFTVDTSRVNMRRAGTYYAVYSATDKEGNVGSFRRQVVVNHDEEDTAALAASIAENLSSDVMAIRSYVLNSIWYSHSWGGDDPVWYGFKNQNGNCYVHALCFQALLREKGYETQLIWTTCKTHYWNLVKINGEWKHMDTTPSNLHERYSIMSDAQRLETLSGRTWDRSAWPACE